MKLCSDEALYFGIASSKVPDEVLVNAPNLIHDHETEKQGKQLDTGPDLLPKVLREPAS